MGVHAMIIVTVYNRSVATWLSAIPTNGTKGKLSESIQPRYGQFIVRMSRVTGALPARCALHLCFNIYTGRHD